LQRQAARNTKVEPTLDLDASMTLPLDSELR